MTNYSVQIREGKVWREIGVYNEADAERIRRQLEETTGKTCRKEKVE